MVENMEHSVEFYKETLGLPLKFQSDNWTEFNTRGTILSLHGGGKKVEPIVSNNEPHSSIAGMGSISFNVNDIQSIYDYLKSKGVQFSLPPTKRSGEEIILAVCHDPDGFEICFAQSLNE